MTRQEWWRRAIDQLKAAGCADAAFDARCMLEDLGGLPRSGMPDECPLTVEQEAILSAALAKRATGYPLQYLLGQWDFLTLTLSVGEGVLIPRADTEVLCEETAKRLPPSPRVLDLCAGSGCVGLGIASLRPDAQVTALELSEQAWPYLQENIARYPTLSVTAEKADVLEAFSGFSPIYDAIVSNPPYIPTGDLPDLMREVQHEPVMALDGDTDGLLFYRVIAREWSRKLCPGGLCAVEVGFEQAAAVATLFTEAGLTNVTSIPDLQGVDRVVLGTRQ